MAIIKLHNPVLAENSAFGNFIVETLAADPANASSGRIWFNSTEGKIKIATVNAAGTGVDLKFLADADNVASLDADIVSVNAGITTLNSITDAINSEIDAIDILVATAGTDIDTLEAGVIALDTNKVEKINISGAVVGSSTEIPVITYNEQGQITESSTAAIDITLQGVTDLGDTTTNGITAGSLTTPGDLVVGGNAVIGTDIKPTDVLVKGAITTTHDLTVGGNLIVSGTTTTIHSEELTIADNKVVLNSGIGSIAPTENAGIQVDRGNEGILTIVEFNEATDTVQIPEWQVATSTFVMVDVATATDIDDANARITTVAASVGLDGDNFVPYTGSTYMQAAGSLVNAIEMVDYALSTSLADLQSQSGSSTVGYQGYTEGDATIVDPTVEVLAGGTVEGALDKIASDVNSRFNSLDSSFVKAEVASADKSDVYSIAHNLDTTFLDVDVQVYDEDDAVWRFDLVVIEVTDANTVTISLAGGVAQQIRYVIRGY